MLPRILVMIVWRILGETEGCQCTHDKRVQEEASHGNGLLLFEGKGYQEMGFDVPR